MKLTNWPKEIHAKKRTRKTIGPLFGKKSETEQIIFVLSNIKKLSTFA